MLMATDLGFTSLLPTLKAKIDLRAKAAEEAEAEARKIEQQKSSASVGKFFTTAQKFQPAFQPQTFQPQALPQAGQFPGAQALPVSFLPPFPLADPWYKRPLILGAIGAGVLVLGAGGYMLARR